jgi:glycosyltransferase 2 family protein
VKYSATVRGTGSALSYPPPDHRVHSSRSHTLTSPTSPDASARRARAVRLTKGVLQFLAITGALWVLVRIARPNWGVLTAVPFTIHWGTLALASGIWLASFIFLVQLWAASLAWWSERLAGFAALRMFVLSNLARYIPGVIWQFTGLALFAMEERVSPLAAAASVLLQQLVLLATGLLLALAFAPAMLGAFTAALPLGVQVGAVAAGLGLLLWLFPIALPALQPRLERVLRRRLPLPRPPSASFVRYLLGSVIGWVGYGTSFWLFARALFGAAAPGPLVAGTAFVASYVVGIIAVFAPGGIVVRETALVAALAGQIGTDRAFLLAVGARLWLVALEIVGALALIVSGAGRSQGLRSTKTN